MTILPTHLSTVFGKAYDMIRKGELKTLIPFLGLFRLNGKPMTLRMHYQFAPLFNTTQAPNTCVMSGRQVGKSTTISASNGLRNMLIPYYHTVLVQPRADQIQRLINTSYKPLLASCPIREAFISSTELSKMALREFKNGSLCYAEFAYSNADRLRGIANAAQTTWDESLSADVKVKVFDEQAQKWIDKQILDIKAGDFLASFDGNAIVNSVTVRDASFHGERSCFAIITQSGRVITGTADHCLQTNKGRKRIGEIIDELYGSVANDGCAVECGDGKSAGGWIHHQKRKEDGTCPVESWLQADAVPANEIWPVARGMYTRTREETESRLRRLVGLPVNQSHRTIGLCVCASLPEWNQNQNDHTGISGSNNPPDSAGMVVHGRRQQSQGQQLGDYTYERIYTGRSGAVGFVATNKMGCGLLSEARHSFKYGEDRICDSATTTGIHYANESDRSVCSCMHGVQDSDHDDRMCVLRTSNGAGAQVVLLDGVCQRIQKTCKTSVLRGEQRALHNQEQRVGECAQGTNTCGSACPLRCDDTRTERSSECLRENVSGQEPRTIPCSKTRLQGSTQERSCVQRTETPAVCEALSENKAGSCEICETVGTTKSGQETAAQTSKGTRIPKPAQNGPTCQGSAKAAGISGTESTSGEAGKHDSGRAQGIPEGICQRAISQTHSGDDAGTARCLEAETTRAQYATHSEQDRSGSYQGPGTRKEAARVVDTGTKSIKGSAEESLGCEEESGIISPTTGNFFYDPIVSIEYVGERPVYDIEVVGTHNYILANGICSYNCQDIEYEFLNIGNETMSASLYWGFAFYTGTPKTTDTTLALLWDRSSKAEWVIKCTHCGYFNVPNPEHDLLKMIGKEGPVCAKCGKPISPRNGGYVHAEPDKALSFPGYHISQTIHPLHAEIPSKWQRLLDKVHDYRELELYNEVFGWPYDASVSPLTLSDMKKAVHEPITTSGKKVVVTKPEDIERIADQYRYITVGVDWSGGGMVSDSYTAYAIIGLRADSDVIDVLYGKRLPKGMSPTEEADEILAWISGVGADAFAYDNGGAGFTRLEIMNHQGLRSIPNLIVVPINYVRPHSGDVMQPHTGQREADLYYYTLDKSRSLAITLMAIKSCRLRFPPFAPEDNKAYQMDFLALREDPRQSLGNETVILITKKPGVPDDFAHAVNFGCSQIWDHFGAYPRIGSRYDASILDYDENHHKIMEDETFGPRGDFERFREALETRAAVVSPDSMLW